MAQELIYYDEEDMKKHYHEVCHCFALICLLKSFEPLVTIAGNCTFKKKSINVLVKKYETNINKQQHIMT